MTVDNGSHSGSVWRETQSEGVVVEVGGIRVTPTSGLLPLSARRGLKLDRRPRLTPLAAAAATGAGVKGVGADL